MNNFFNNTLDTTMSINTKVSYKIKISEVSEKILHSYANIYATEINVNTKQSANDIKFKLANDLLNMAKSADIELNNLSGLTLIDNKISGKNKTDFAINGEVAGKYLDEILSSGRVTVINKKTNKETTVFLKGLRYFNTVKKQWVTFNDFETFKSFDNNFKHYATNMFIIKKLMFRGAEITKVDLKSINQIA